MLDLLCSKCNGILVYTKTNLYAQHGINRNSLLITAEACSQHGYVN